MSLVNSRSIESCERLVLAPLSVNSITPWWRTLKIGGELNAKYPGGIEAQMTRLESEGHTVVQRGKRYFVDDFNKKLVGP